MNSLPLPENSTNLIINYLVANEKSTKIILYDYNSAEIVQSHIILKSDFY